MPGPYTEAEPFIRAVSAFINPVVTKEEKDKLPWKQLEATFLVHLKRAKDGGDQSQGDPSS